MADEVPPVEAVLDVALEVVLDVVLEAVLDVTLEVVLEAVLEVVLETALELVLDAVLEAVLEVVLEFVLEEFCLSEETFELVSTSILALLPHQSSSSDWSISLETIEFCELVVVSLLLSSLSFLPQAARTLKIKVMAKSVRIIFFITLKSFLCTLYFLNSLAYYT